jgi:hypothetical protein
MKTHELKKARMARKFHRLLFLRVSMNRLKEIFLLQSIRVFYVLKNSSVKFVFVREIIERVAGFKRVKKSLTSKNLNIQKWVGEKIDDDLLNVERKNPRRNNEMRHSFYF